MATKVSFHGKQIIIRTTSLDWGSIDKIVESSLFRTVLSNFLKMLRENDSEFLKLLPAAAEEEQETLTLELMKKLAKDKKSLVSESNPKLKIFFADSYLLDKFIEAFYDYWISHERYFICLSDPKCHCNENIDKMPYRTFNDTIEKLNHMVRKLYRDVRENITGEHPVIYRQVPAGSPMGVIASSGKALLPHRYDALSEVPFVRQVLMVPPVLMDPPMNKRIGEFALVNENPVDGLKFNPDDWLCFPAKVGELTIYLYFHNFYTNLGLATSNLFKLCNDEELKKKPDGIYVYGVPPEAVRKFASGQTLFYRNKTSNLMVAAVPLGEEFAYFGYIKKMMLTLHNSIMIHRGRLAVHGAMVRLALKGGERANIILVGDSGAGKSESIEAFRVLSGENLKELKVVFDDMGSLKLGDGGIKAYGTEIGAFVRLDDLAAGYAFSQLDRAIIMSPHKVNARVVVPVTTLEEILHGWPVDYFLYTNNYETVEDGNYIEQFSTPEKAIDVFRAGKIMAKGTTHMVGLSQSYYSNIFGPTQFREEHEAIAANYFDAIFREGIFVGQIRTQLGIKGMETLGPQNAAKALFELIRKRSREKKPDKIGELKVCAK